MRFGSVILAAGAAQQQWPVSVIGIVMFGHDGNLIGARDGTREATLGTGAGNA